MWLFATCGDGMAAFVAWELQTLFNSPNHHNSLNIKDGEFRLPGHRGEACSIHACVRGKVFFSLNASDDASNNDVARVFRLRMVERLFVWVTRAELSAGGDGGGVGRGVVWEALRDPALWRSPGGSVLRAHDKSDSHP